MIRRTALAVCVLLVGVVFSCADNVSAQTYPVPTSKPSFSSSGECIQEIKEETDTKKNSATSNIDSARGQLVGVKDRCVDETISLSTKGVLKIAQIGREPDKVHDECIPNLCENADNKPCGTVVIKILSSTGKSKLKTLSKCDSAEVFNKNLSDAFPGRRASALGAVSPAPLTDQLKTADFRNVQYGGTPTPEQQALFSSLGLTPDQATKIIQGSPDGAKNTADLLQKLASGNTDGAALAAEKLQLPSGQFLQLQSALKDNPVFLTPDKNPATDITSVVPGRKPIPPDTFSQSPAGTSFLASKDLPSASSGTSIQGIASCYGQGLCHDGNYFEGRMTRYGDVFRSNLLTASSNQLPPGYYQVACTAGCAADSQPIIVKVNDTGGHILDSKRLLDLSMGSMLALRGNGGLVSVNVARVAAPGSPLRVGMLQ